MGKGRLERPFPSVLVVVVCVFLAHFGGKRHIIICDQTKLALNGDPALPTIPSSSI